MRIDLLHHCKNASAVWPTKPVLICALVLFVFLCNPSIISGQDVFEDDAPPTPRLKKKKKKLEFKKNGGVVYQTIDGVDIKCDVYVPEGDGPFPAILAVHGGAWRQGSKVTMIRHAWMMAQSGYVVMAINYRHAPKYRFPAQVHDCKHAVRWMKSNAAKYRIDVDRVGAFGYSAGGHLVAMLGTTDTEDGLEGDIKPEFEKFDSSIKAVMIGGAPCEFEWIGKDSRLLAYWLGGTPKEKAEVYRAASPTTYVSADDPPFYIYHGSSDLLVPISTSKALHERLVKTGVSSEHSTANGHGHLVTFSDLQWMKKGIKFFDETLK